MQICIFIHACIYRLSSDTTCQTSIIVGTIIIEMVDWSVYIIILSTYLVYQGEITLRYRMLLYIIHQLCRLCWMEWKDSTNKIEQILITIINC